MEQQQINTTEQEIVCPNDTAKRICDYVRNSSIEFIEAGLDQPTITIGELSTNQGINPSKLLQLIVYEDLLVQVQGATYRLWIRGLDLEFLYTRPNQVFSKRERKTWQKAIGKALTALRNEAAPSSKRVNRLTMKQTYQNCSRKVVKSKPRDGSTRTDITQAIGLDRLQIYLLPYESRIRENLLSQRPFASQRTGKVSNLQNSYVASEASRLALPPERFLDLWDTSNLAFEEYTILGPFYGAGEKGKTTPTFRVSAEPVRIPLKLIGELEQLGSSLWELAMALEELPAKYKAILGSDYSFSPPFTWRLDTIFTDTDQFFVNEIEVNDGADALMVAEQVAYGLQSLDGSTAFYITQAILERCVGSSEEPVKVAWIWDKTLTNYIPNAVRMSEFIDQISAGQIQIQVIDLDYNTELDWTNFNGVINSSTISPSYLCSRGINPLQIILSGSFAAMGNKALFGLISLQELEEFWQRSIGQDTLEILQDRLIPTCFISNRQEISQAADSKNTVLKIYLSPERDTLECGRGVFGPWSKKSDWDRAIGAFDRGARFIRQPFIRPAQIETYLRSNGGKTIEKVNWYNRVCVKYVVTNNQVSLTATEATLGPNFVPTGRDCCFAPVVFK